METKFGVWLKSKGFARLFPVIVVAAMGYLGLRIATALRWGGPALVPAGFRADGADAPPGGLRPGGAGMARFGGCRHLDPASDLRKCTCPAA